MVPTPADTDENRALAARAKAHSAYAPTAAFAGILRLPWAPGDPWGAAAARAIGALAERARFFVEPGHFKHLDEYQRSRRIFADLRSAYGAAAPVARTTAEGAYRAWCAVRHLAYVMRLESDWQAWLRDEHNEGCTDYRQRLDYDFRREGRVPDGTPTVRFEPGGEHVDPAEWNHVAWLVMKPDRPRA